MESNIKVVDTTISCQGQLTNAQFNYFDKAWSVLFATSRFVSTASFATAIGAPVVIKSESASLSLVFCISMGVAKKPLKILQK